MREIKFRAWAKHLGLMAAVDILHSDGVVRLQGFADDFVSEGVALMQHTGLKDKNGVEIYEGDILDLLGDKKYLVSVGWDEKSAGFASYRNGERNSASLFGVELSEIIGNIYSNPELLN